MKAKKALERWLSGPIGWARLVLVLIAGGGVLTLIVAAIDDHIVTHQRASFVKVPCYIVSCVVSREPGRDDRNMPGWEFVPVVTYRYEVNGQKYEGHNVSSRTTPLSRAAGEAFLFRFGPGSDAECFIDPEDPTDSMLELPTNAQAQWFAKIGGTVLLLSLLALGALQLMLTLDTAPPRPQMRAPGWGEIDSGPNDPLAKTRQILKERLES